MSFLETDEFNVLKFVNFPKCKGAWRKADGSGCLMTAFLEGGFNKSTEMTKIYEIDKFAVKCKIPTIMYNEMHKLINKSVVICSTDTGIAEAIKTYNGTVLSFTDTIINLYDSGHEVLALDLLWKLIEKIPNKVRVLTEKDIQMPEVGVKVSA